MQQLEVINILKKSLNFSDHSIEKLKKFTQLVLKENQTKNPNIDNIISNYKPPIFWKDKELVRSQMKEWDLDKIRKLMFKLGEIELSIKKHNSCHNKT